MDDEMDNDECHDSLDVTYPSTPIVGTVWIDTSTMNTNVYTGQGWTTVTYPGNETMPASPTFALPVVFVNYMPRPSDIEAMCKEYPALEKAYENFKTVYKMVKQDWDGKQKSN